MTLDIIRADLLAQVNHGFFGRAGGASSGIFAGLNCGPGSSDQEAAVATNRARVATAMGGPLRAVHQVHSADVVVVDGPMPVPQPRADALVTATRGQVLTVLAADCQPVLFHAPGIVGAAHAGWRGTLAGVLEATVDAMERLGAVRGDIRAAIGPCISQRAYEVGPDLFDAVIADDADAGRHFAGGHGDRMQFDLPGYALRRLRAAGVRAEWTGHCTCSDAARFYSYRRATLADEADYGRQIAAIRL